MNSKVNLQPQDEFGAEPPSDAIVIFGITGDLAHKKIILALCAVIGKGRLKSIRNWSTTIPSSSTNEGPGVRARPTS